MVCLFPNFNFFSIWAKSHHTTLEKLLKHQKTPSFCDLGHRPLQFTPTPVLWVGWKWSYPLCEGRKSQEVIKQVLYLGNYALKLTLEDWTHWANLLSGSWLQSSQSYRKNCCLSRKNAKFTSCSQAYAFPPKVQIVIRHHPDWCQEVTGGIFLEKNWIPSVCQQRAPQLHTHTKAQIWVHGHMTKCPQVKCHTAVCWLDSDVQPITDYCTSGH